MALTRFPASLSWAPEWLTVRLLSLWNAGQVTQRTSSPTRTSRENYCREEAETDQWSSGDHRQVFHKRDAADVRAPAAPECAPAPCATKPTNGFWYTSTCTGGAWIPTYSVRNILLTKTHVIKQRFLKTTAVWIFLMFSNWQEHLENARSWTGVGGSK